MSYNKSNFYNAALYLRLSREDGDKVESDSIHNQRELAKDFLKTQSNITIKKEYVDDGYSGTNFERPGFQAMMADIEKGEINCIIVKDLSRLGRNYIETGRLLEKIFPLLGIRFIAVNDHYDSLQDHDGSDQIIIPFKNLINDAYCKDISTKIRSQLDMKRKTGQFIGSFACYGYKKDPDNKNHLVIDEYSGKMVRYIFNLKLEGYSSFRIAQKLDEMGVLTPLEYKRALGYHFTSGFRAKSNPKWSVTSVNRILKSETYTGMVVQGKHEKINYKVKESRAVPEGDWYRVEDMHDAIVTKEEFAMVQELLEHDTRTAPEEATVYLFSGYVKCKACGQNMVRRRSRKNGRDYVYYHCSTYKNGDGCSSHIISQDRLEELVILAIRNYVNVIVKAREVMDTIGEGSYDSVGFSLLEKQMQALEAEEDRYRELKIHLYQDLQDGIVGKEEYQDIGSRFSMKMQSAREKKAALEKEKEKLLLGNNGLRPWMEEFEKYENIEKLDRRIVVSLLNQVTVENKDHIEVHFRFEDELRWLLKDAETLAVPMKSVRQEVAAL